MKRQPPSLLALSALMLCTLHQTEPAWSGTFHGSRSAPASSSSSPSSTTSSSTASPSEVMRGRDNVETLKQKQTNISTNYGNQSQKSGASSSKLEAGTAQVNTFSFNTSRENISTVMSDWAPGRSSKEEASSHCAYRVFEGGIGGQLCFRNTLLGYKCEKPDCRTVVSLGNLLANILINGSVLLQWSQEGESIMADQGKTLKTAANSRRGGYELSCWWNGSYTQFECAGVHLGSSCSDFLLTDLHENIPYRLCLRSLSHSNLAQSADQRDCIEFTLPPSGMQDIVIAMTTVGGAICVMLVIICLLVAYITENIMTPTTQHTYSYRTHSCH